MMLVQVAGLKARERRWILFLGVLLLKTTHRVSRVLLIKVSANSFKLRSCGREQLGLGCSGPSPVTL